MNVTKETYELQSCLHTFTNTANKIINMPMNKNTENRYRSELAGLQQKELTQAMQAYQRLMQKFA